MRIIKAATRNIAVYENGQPKDRRVEIRDFKLYPGPHITVDGTRSYTKHYFAGDRRIAAQVMTGSPFIITRKGTAAKGAEEDVYGKLRKLQLHDMQRYFENTKIQIAPPAPGVVVDTPDTGTAARPRLQIYWYHPNHLGTGTLITGSYGNPHQFFLNLPYGETMVELGGYQYHNPYKFNGKELDEETRLYYYGARYYDPKISLWLSVDPLAEKYPSMSPYNYVVNNPVRYIDPTGMFCVDANGKQIPCPEEFKKYTGPTKETAVLDNGKMIATLSEDEEWGGVLDEVTLSTSCSSIEAIKSTATGMSIGGMGAGLFSDKIDEFKNGKLLLQYYNPKTGIFTLNMSAKEMEGLSASLRQLHTLRVTAKGLSQIGNYASVLNPLLEFINEEYFDAFTEGLSAGIGIYLAQSKGNIYGLAWSVGWEGGRKITSMEWYNRKIYGRYSDVYIKNAIKYRWDVELDLIQIRRANYLIKTGQW